MLLNRAKRFSPKQMILFVAVFAGLGSYFLWLSLAGTIWGNWADLHGGFLSGPGVASMADGKLDVFAVGNDHAMWHKWCLTAADCNNNIWSNWTSLGGYFTSDPAAVSWADGHIDVFARGADNALWHNRFDTSSGWGNWTSLGGTLTSSPAVASMAEGKLDVFARGGNNSLYHRWCLSISQCNNGPWSSWTDLGGNLTGGPAAVSWGTSTDGKIAVYAPGANGTVQHIYYDQSANWGSWVNQGGCLNGDPAVASWGSGRLDLLGRGCDNALWHASSADGNQWTWEKVAGALSSSPDAVAWGGRHFDVFARGGNNGMYKIGYDITATPTSADGGSGTPTPSHAPTYGLAFNPTAARFITMSPDFSQISGPNSAYPTATIRTIVKYNDPNGPNIIQADIQYAQQNMGYVSGTAPVVISMGVGNNDVNAFAGSNVCTNTASAACSSETERLLNQYLPALMDRFPQIKYWTAVNEPENGGQPTNAGEGGSSLAAQLWADADKIARPRGRVMLAGESWNINSSFERNYEKNIVQVANANGLPLPSAWAFHPYDDVVCARNSDTTAFINDLKTNGLYNAMQGGQGLWATEAGVQLETRDSCSNAVNLANQARKDTSTLTANDVGTMELLQINSANAFMNLYKADPNIDFHMFYYTPDPGSPECWGGGAWDSGLWAPDVHVTGSVEPYGTNEGIGYPGTRRPAFYVLTKQTVPNLPQTLGVKKAALVLVPPFNWSPTVPWTVAVQNPNCHYSTPLPTAP